MKKIEILAPAGSYESLVAAINAGCDALYIGGSKFGARAYANNLNEEDLLKAIDYVHLHGKKIYLTINTLLKEDELEKDLFTYLEKYYECGIDAVIVQDLGVMNYIHKNFQDLPIHASTQLSLTMAKGVETIAELGVTRLVTSRELSFEEIREIRDNTNIEIESFVHGALCYCYSGQCLMSSMIGGRSGNRGRCAQPCRMPYKLVQDGNKIISKEKEKYLLSPKDICTLSIIPELIGAGIDSFKIEGRMKKPEYTALVVSLYRKYVDLYYELGEYSYKEYIDKNKKVFDNDITMLMDMYNRGGFTNGYYVNHNGKNMMASRRPNHCGVLVGEVSGIKAFNATILTNENIHSQDVLEIRINDDEAYEYTVKNPSNQGDVINANYMAKYKVRPGQKVYRTKNAKLINEIRNIYIKDEIKIPIYASIQAKIGMPLSLTLFNNEISVTTYGDQVQTALNQPITKDNIFNQINKTNTTMFFFEDFTIINDENIFIPVAKLNQLRRLAIDNLTLKLLEKNKRKKIKKDKSNITESDSLQKKHNKEMKFGLSVHLTKLEHLYEAIKHKEVDHIYLDTSEIDFCDIKEVASLVRSYNKQFYLVLPHIFRKETYETFLANKETLSNNNITGFIIKNLEGYNFIKSELLDQDYRDAKSHLVLDYNVYTMNNQSKNFWRNKGIDNYTTSVELNYQELSNLGCSDSDIIVYGYLPVMVSAQCLLKNTKGCTKETKTLDLIDRYNKKFRAINYCKYCYNVIYNESPISLLKNSEDVKRLNPKNIRLDFTFESKDEVYKIIDGFVKEFKYDDKINNVLTIKDYTKGHFKRGIE